MTSYIKKKQDLWDCEEEQGINKMNEPAEKVRAEKEKICTLTEDNLKVDFSIEEANRKIQMLQSELETIQKRQIRLNAQKN